VVGEGRRRGRRSAPGSSLPGNPLLPPAWTRPAAARGGRRRRAPGRFLRFPNVSSLSRLEAAVEGVVRLLLGRGVAQRAIALASVCGPAEAWAAAAVRCAPRWRVLAVLPARGHALGVERRSAPIGARALPVVAHAVTCTEHSLLPRLRAGRRVRAVSRAPESGPGSHPGHSAARQDGAALRWRVGPDRLLERRRPGACSGNGV